MLGGTRWPEIADSSDLAIEEIVHRLLRKHLGILEKPAALLIKKAKHAIPQFEIGYLQWKKEFEGEAGRLFPRLMLSGSCWGGVSINDCIAQARCLAKKVLS